MKQSDYDRLLIQMGEYLGIHEVAPLQSIGLLRVGGRDLLFQYDEVAEPDAIQARLDMGTVNQDQRDWMWHRLLLSNFEWGTNGILGWSLTPDGDHVILTAQHPFDAQFTGVALANWLRNLVACADAYWLALPSRRPVAEIRSLAPLLRATLPARPGATSWATLIEAFCEHVCLAERQYLLTDGDTLTVDGIDMLLRHDQAAPGRFEVRIDLGMEFAIPRETLWQGLLWNNFVMGLGGRVLFSVRPEPETVVLALQQDLPGDATAEEFAELLRVIAGNAKTFWIEARTTIARAETALQKTKMSA